jgi:hypothetical protein
MRIRTKDENESEEGCGVVPGGARNDPRDRLQILVQFLSGLLQVVSRLVEIRMRS